MESNADPHVYDDRRQRDDNHQASTGRFGIAEALDGLESNDQGDDHERHGVGESGEDTDAVIPERHAMMRRLLRHPQRVPAQAQGAGVGQVVPGIGQQGQAVSEPPGQRFRHHERKRDGDGRGHRPGRSTGRPVTVVVCVWMNGRAPCRLAAAVNAAPDRSSENGRRGSNATTQQPPLYDAKRDCHSHCRGDPELPRRPELGGRIVGPVHVARKPVPKVLRHVHLHEGLLSDQRALDPAVKISSTTSDTNECRIPIIESSAALVQNIPLPTRGLCCAGASAGLRARLRGARSPSVARHRAIECTECDTCLQTRRGRVTETTGSHDAIGDGG